MVGTSSSRVDAREQVVILRPDVVLIDVAASESLELIHDLRAEWRPCKILAFAVAEGSADILECAEAGAAGYVTAEASIEDLVRPWSASLVQSLHARLESPRNCSTA